MRSAEAVAGMLCPVCKVSLQMSDRQGVEIDYCPQCRGVWLDRGELDKIIERSADYDARPAEPQHQPQTGAGLGGLADVARDVLKGSKYGGGYGQGGYGHGDGPRYGKKRKKSFLEQIFD